MEVGLFIGLKRKYPDDISDTSKEMSGQTFNSVATPQKNAPQKEKGGERAEFVLPLPKIKM